MIDQALNALTTGLELFSAVLIFLGGIEAALGTIKGLVTDRSGRWMRNVWQKFAGWIVLSLEFALGADIVATIQAPTWDELGQLALLALVRTVLNYFLTMDMETVHRERAPSGADTVK